MSQNQPDLFTGIQPEESELSVGESQLVNSVLGLHNVPTPRFTGEQLIWFEDQARRLIFQSVRHPIDFSNPIQAAKENAYYQAGIDTFLTLADSARNQN